MGRFGFETHWQEKIDNIHDDQNKVTNSGHVVDIARRNQGSGDDVVAKHLPMILAALLNVDDDDLLKPKCPLRQDISLHQAVKLTVGPVGP